MSAASPEFQMDQWAPLDHCGVRNMLEREGWRFVAASDWAVVLADPARQYAARISPFELAYQQFVELCRRHPSNRWLPTIYAATDLEGGGHATVMEFLTARTVPDDDQPDPVWSSDAPDLREVRRDVELTDAECRATVPWWGGVDVKAEHFMLDQAGQLKLCRPLLRRRSRRCRLRAVRLRRVLPNAAGASASIYAADSPLLAGVRL